MIRSANLSDIPAIMAMSREIHSQTHYGVVPIDVTKYQKTLRMMMNSQQHLVLIAETDDEEPIGFMLGVSQEHFAIQGKFATDLLIYAKPRHPGAGTRMIRRFLMWARTKRDVTMILMGISNDVADEVRLGDFYERQGLKRVGSLYQEMLPEVEHLRQAQ